MKIFNQYLLLSLLFFTVSCSPKKNERNIVSRLQPAIIETKGHIIPQDSMAEPTVIPVDESKLKKVAAGKPEIIPANTNVHAAGNPEIVLASIPEICTPGKGRFQIPETVPITDSPFAAGVPEVVVAKDIYTRDVNPQNFNSFSKQQGLTHGYIRCLLQDKKGNLWFGTLGGGVTKYDGRNFTHYTVKEGLCNNSVVSILEDKSGNFWFGTDGGGISKFDGKYFISFTDKKCMNVYSILEDKSGNIWFGTIGGVKKYDGKNFTRFTTKQGLSNNAVFSILEDRKGNLWFGTSGGGVSKYDGKSFTNFTIKEGLGNNVVRSIEEDKSGNLWFGTMGGGAVKYDGKFFSHYTTKEGLSNNLVSCIRQDKSGNLWFGTWGGISKFDGNSFISFTTKDGLSNNTVISMLEDKSGTLWFGTLGGGVNKYLGKIFTHYTDREGLSNSDVTNILEDKNGSLWICTWNGINKYHGKSFAHFTKKEGLSNNIAWRVIEDKKHNLWFATLGGGVCKYDGKYFTHITDKEGLNNNSVLSVIEDSKGNLWFGTWGAGACKYDGKSFTIFTVKQGLCSNVVTSILEDRNGNLWFGSDGAGLAEYDGKSFIHFTTKDGLSNNSITSMIEDRSGNLLFGTDGGGVDKFDGKNFTSFTDREGLSNNSVMSILEDKKGDIWFGTRFGLNNLSKNKLARVSINEKSSSLKTGAILFKTFIYGDGFLGIGCNGGAICEAKDGNIWTGANDRLTAYHPGSDVEDTIAPNIQLTGIELFNENIDWAKLAQKKDSTLTLGNGVKLSKFYFDDVTNWYGLPEHLSLAYDNNYLAFNFIGITQKSPQKVKYQYKLEGMDENWSALSDRSQAPYGNLPPDTYTFKVKAMNSEGSWSKEFDYTFTIRPPWWQTWWFRSLAVVMIISSLYSYYRYRTAALRQRQKHLQKTVEERTEQLRESLKEKEALLKEIHHRVKNNLEVISSLLMLQTEGVTDEKVKAALSEGQSRVQSIALIHHKLYRNEEMAAVEFCGFVKDLYKQVNELFRKPGSDVEFRLMANETLVDIDTAIPLGLIINELLTNSFKYAVNSNHKTIITVQLEEGTKTTVHRKKENKPAVNVMLVYRDNGPGMPVDFNAEKSASLGMKLIAQLAKQIGGKLSYHNDNGTVFQVPFIKATPNLYT